MKRDRKLWLYYCLIIWCIPWCHAAATTSARQVIKMFGLDPSNYASVIGAVIILNLVIVLSNFWFKVAGRYLTVAILILYIVISQSAVISGLQTGHYSQTQTVPLTPIIAIINLVIAFFWLGKPYRKWNETYLASQKKKLDQLL